MSLQHSLRLRTTRLVIAAIATVFGFSSLETSADAATWSNAEVGTGHLAGSALPAGAGWTISGAGTIYGNADGGHFLYQVVSGNADVIARIDGCATTAEYGEQCGPMARASLSADAANAYCFSGEDGTPTYQWRLNAAGATDSDGATSANHQWYRLTIVNGSGTCYWSDNGTSWIQLGAAKPMGFSGSYYVGVAVSSNFDNQLATAAVGSVSVSSAVPAAPPAGDSGGYRPHYQGYGATTLGGRGGTICKVTSVADTDTAGTLRNCVRPRPGCVMTAATCARIVVFETSGTIQLTSQLAILSPYLTVAGQTAPSPGISIRNYDILIDTHDIVLQHLRIRVGLSALNPDETNGINLGSLQGGSKAYNIIFDHMSVSWGPVATTLNQSQWSHDISIFDSIISEGLYRPKDGFGGTGHLIFPSSACATTLARNFYAHNQGRNPWIGPGCQVSGYNNVIYNPRADANDAGTGGFMMMIGSGYTNYNWLTEVVWAGNVNIAGPNTFPNQKPVKISSNATQIAAGVQIWLKDNVDPANVYHPVSFMAAGQWNGVTICPDPYSACGTGEPQAATLTNVRGINGNDSTLPAWHTAFQYQVLPSSEVQLHVLANAGARPLDRDAVDTRVVADARNLTGTDLIDNESRVGGHPALAVNTRPYQIPASPNAPGTCGTTVDGLARTAIECDLEAMAAALEPANGMVSAHAPAAPVNLRIVGSSGL